VSNHSGTCTILFYHAYYWNWEVKRGLRGGYVLGYWEHVNLERVLNGDVYQFNSFSPCSFGHNMLYKIPKWIKLWYWIIVMNQTIVLYKTPWWIWLMNHSIILYTKEQSDLNLHGIQNSKCEIEVKNWEIQLSKFEKGVKFARFLYLFLVNCQIYKRITKKLYFHGCLLLYRDLAKYSHGWSPLLLNPFYGQSPPWTTSQNSSKKIPLNLILKEWQQMTLRILIWLSTCMYVCMYLDSQMSLWLLLRGWRRKEGARRINWVVTESWVLIPYDDSRNIGNDFVVWREENFATWWIWLVRLIALEWFGGLISECFTQMPQMICAGSSVVLVQLKSQDPSWR